MDKRYKEEQIRLDNVINDLDEALKEIDYRLYETKVKMQRYYESCLADAYGALVQSNKDKKGYLSKKINLQNTRKELYHNRLVVEAEEEGKTKKSDLLVGLHTYFYKGKNIIYSWYNPLCANYILGNKTSDFQCVVKDKHGDEYLTEYKLLLQRKVELYNDKVQKITDMYNILKPVDEKIIADEFLSELMKRREEVEFQNIVFSIQEQQANIIQSPFRDNIIVQGCAGSGKSMIMLHRLPILLFSRHDIRKSDIYIITPSTTYIDMAKNMIIDLEIEDVKMGTINQYYRHVISKYYNNFIYPKKKSSIKLDPQIYKWIYSDDIILDIKNSIRAKISEANIEYSKFYKQLNLTQSNSDHKIMTFKEEISQEILNLQKILNANSRTLKVQFHNIKGFINEIKKLADTLKNRKLSIVRDLNKQIQDEVKVWEGALKDLEIINKDKNPIMYKNREDIVQSSIKKEENLKQFLLEIMQDNEFFNVIEAFSTKIYNFLEKYPEVDDNFEKNKLADIYKHINDKEIIYNFANGLLNKLEKIKDDYYMFGKGFLDDIKSVRNLANSVTNNNEPYISMNDMVLIYTTRNNLDDLNKSVVQDAISMIQNKAKEMDVRFNKNVYYDFIPYIYLQIIYTYQGAPNKRLEGLLAIDEAQNLEVTEYKLLKDVNKNVVFNLYGDINQHVESEKGIDDWEQIKDVVSFNIYDMNNNYRNAQQITEYCNEKFNMNMNVINISGHDVKEIDSERDIIDFIKNLRIEKGKTGLSAIIFKDRKILKLVESLNKVYKSFNIINDGNKQINANMWNVISVDNAKGIEFKRALVIEIGMTKMEKYIACTRALDELIVYKGNL